MDRKKDGWADGWTEGQTDKRDFIGCCLTNVERPATIFCSIISENKVNLLEKMKDGDFIFDYEKQVDQKLNHQTD